MRIEQAEVIAYGAAIHANTLPKKDDEKIKLMIKQSTHLAITL